MTELHPEVEAVREIIADRNLSYENVAEASGIELTRFNKLIGQFTRLCAGRRLSVWRLLVGRVREETLHHFGRPARLENEIASGQLIPHPIESPADTFWTRSVVRWQKWQDSSYMLDYRKPGYERRRLEQHTIAVPEVEQLISEEKVSHFSCDITDIRGISASKSMAHDILDIDEFPMLRCQELVEPVTEDHLRKNMLHGELRLDRMRFAEYSWAARRFYWLNDGGSHHLAAARYQACRLGIAVPLTGELYRYDANVQMIDALLYRWHLFVIPAKELFHSFFHAMNSFECPFGNSDLPLCMHDTDKSGVALKLVWLERAHPKANAVADVLSSAGFPNFGEQLALLATKKS